MARALSIVAAGLSLVLLESSCARKRALVLEVCGHSAERCDPNDTLVADGHTPIIVRACTQARMRPAALQVTLRVSSGSWQNAPTEGRAFVTIFDSDGCVSPSFVPPSTPDAVRIDAEVGVFRATKWVALKPAPVLD